jgi:hypothetical protein
LEEKTEGLIPLMFLLMIGPVSILYLADGITALKKDVLKTVRVDNSVGVGVDLSDGLSFSLDETLLLSDAELGLALDAILKGDWRQWVPERLPPYSEVKDPCDSGFWGPDPKF